MTTEPEAQQRDPGKPSYDDPVELADRLEQLLSESTDGALEASLEEVGAVLADLSGDEAASDVDLAQAAIAILEERGWRIGFRTASTQQAPAPPANIGEEFLSQAGHLLSELESEKGDRLKLLSPNAERRLLEIVERGTRVAGLVGDPDADQESRDAWFAATELATRAERQLVARNIRFVWKILEVHFPWVFGDPSVDFDDLIQEGCIGLLKAIRRFNVSRGTRLTTYAGWWIRQTIQRSLNDNLAVIHLPAYLRGDLKKVAAAVEIWKAIPAHRGKTIFKTLAELSGVSEERVRMILRMPTRVASIIEGANSKAPMDITDRQEAEDFYAPDFRLESAERAEAVRRALDSCIRSKRERRVANARFGFDGEDAETLEVLGRKLGLTRERVRQIESRILERLRHPSRSEPLKLFAR